MHQQYMVAPDHEQTSLCAAIGSSTTTTSWKSLLSNDERGSSPADVSCSGHESMDTTRSFLENPHQTLASNHEGGLLSAILWSSRSMNSPTKLQQQRDEHHIDRESALWQIESDSSSAGASSSLLHQKDSQQIALSQTPMSPLFLVGDGNSRNKKNQAPERFVPERNGPPFVLKYCPLQHVERIQHLCIKEGSPLNKLPHIPSRTSMMMLQQATGCDQMVPDILKAMQSRHTQEQPIQESALPHLCEERSHDNDPRGLSRQQRDKVGYHDKSASELDKSDLFCHDSLSLYLDEDTNVMPRPFHPAIGRPEVIIPSSRCLATNLEEDISQRPLASEGTMKNSQGPDNEQADKAVTLLFPERASTYQRSPLPLTWLASRLQSIMHGRTNHLSGFQQSHHVTDHVVPTRASKEDNYCGDDEAAASQVSRQQDSQSCSAFSVSHKNDDDSSSIPCRMPGNNESFAKRTIASDHVIGNATSIASTLCKEKIERKNVANSIDIENKITQTKATNAATPAVKPLNAYNYFYSEMREGILQLNEAEMDMLILNKDKHDETNHNHSCPGRNYTLYQPGLLAHTILRKQNARFSKAERKRMLLSKHWNKDRTTRRKHRTKHGKISFNRMNTIVSTEWNFLPETQKMFYKEVAEADSKHYKEQQAEMSIKSC